VHPGSVVAWHGPAYRRALSASPEQDELGPTNSLQNGERGGEVMCVREVVEWTDGNDGRKIRKAEK
jgi:hypothetical protein